MRIKILFLLIFLSANVFSQKIDEDQVPKDVLIAIETVYSGVKVKTWELKDNNYFATVKVEGQTGKAEITPEGKWLSSKFDVSEKELPSSVATYMATNFDGYKIKDAQFVEDNEEKNYYSVKIQKKGISSGDVYELTFDIKGVLTNSTAPESAKTDKKKTSGDEETSSTKRDKVSKKEKNIDEEDSKNEDSDSKSSKTNKKSTASKSNTKKNNEDEESNDDKPVKKSSSKKATSSTDDNQNASKTKTQKSTSGSIKNKNSKSSKGNEETSSTTGGTPLVVKKFFDKKFPNNKDVKWKKADSNYVVSFTLRDIENKAEITPDAKLVSTTTAMDPKNLFRPIDSYLEKNYKKYKITIADKVLYDRNYAKQFPEKKLKNYFMVRISQKVKRSKNPQITTIYFDSKGTLDRVEEGDFGDEDQGNDDNNSKKKDKDSDEE